MSIKDPFEVSSMPLDEAISRLGGYWQKRSAKGSSFSVEPPVIEQHLGGVRESMSPAHGFVGNESDVERERLALSKTFFKQLEEKRAECDAWERKLRTRYRFWRYHSKHFPMWDLSLKNILKDYLKERELMDKRLKERDDTAITIKRLPDCLNMHPILDLGQEVYLIDSYSGNLLKNGILELKTLTITQRNISDNSWHQKKHPDQAHFIVSYIAEGDRGNNICFSFDKRSQKEPLLPYQLPSGYSNHHLFADKNAALAFRNEHLKRIADQIEATLRGQ